MESYKKSVYFDQYGIVHCISTAALDRHLIFPDTTLVHGALTRVHDLRMFDTRTNMSVELTAYMLKDRLYRCFERTESRADL